MVVTCGKNIICWTAWNSNLVLREESRLEWENFCLMENRFCYTLTLVSCYCGAPSGSVPRLAVFLSCRVCARRSARPREAGFRGKEPETRREKRCKQTDQVIWGWPHLLAPDSHTSNFGQSCGYYTNFPVGCVVVPNGNGHLILSSHFSSHCMKFVHKNK